MIIGTTVCARGALKVCEINQVARETCCGLEHASSPRRPKVQKGAITFPIRSHTRRTNFPTCSSAKFTRMERELGEFPRKSRFEHVSALWTDRPRHNLSPKKHFRFPRETREQSESKNLFVNLCSKVPRWRWRDGCDGRSWFSSSHWTWKVSHSNFANKNSICTSRFTKLGDPVQGPAWKFLRHSQKAN